MRATLLIAGLIVPLLLITGCGSSEEEDALAAVCSSREGIAKQVDELQSLTLTSATTSQVADSLQAIRDDLGSIRENRAKLSDDRREEVDTANKAFTDQVRDLAGTVGRTVSLDQAKTQLESALKQLGTSYQETFGQIDCS
jgi:ABC-type Fe3+-citrate transport system substrate-binding protein